MFDAASQLIHRGDGTFTTSATEPWYQGRGVYGGLVAAWLARAITAVAGTPDRPLRALTVQCVAPVRAGDVIVTARVVRSGAAVTFVAAELHTADGIGATALATLGRVRGGDAVRADTVPCPVVSPFASIPPHPPMPGVPAFSHHVDYRWVLGALPYQGVEHGEVGGWCRFRGPVTPDEGMFAGLLDVWAPAVLPMLAGFRPAATVELTYHFLTPLPLLGAGPEDAYVSHGRCTWAGDGYAETVSGLWTADGRPVAHQRQLVAVL